ncbi:MucBP domain-containing protein, partial [Lactobacillus delbrueckii]|uniref:MucBP domain-containing protein n=1 Tax=Lactobacillus delbrueckii TaxID=1584 RepID=UPI003995C97F
LVSNDFKDGTTTYAKEGNDFIVKLKHKTQTITPNDPNPVTPGNPINPKDPNSPVYGEETDRKNLVKDATQTIHYVGAGDKTPADKKQTQKDAFTRTVTIDKVTGKVLETSAWEGTKTFGFEDTPFVEGYHADKKSEGGLTATPDNPDVEATVTYTPNGKLIPIDEEGVHIKDTDTPTYKTDPTDPTKVVDPTVPNVDGYEPRDNKVGDKVTPKDPAKDTEVVYVKTPETKYGLTEKFVDVDGNELSPSESKGSDYKTGDKYDVTKDAKVINGYVLIDTDETTGTFDKSDKTATFIYKKVGKIIPVDKDNNPIPDADTPTYENNPDDPTKVTPNEPTPTVPGWTTDVPNVTPEDPTKDTPVVYTQDKYGLTEKFVDEDGNELSPSESKGTEYKTGDKYDVTKDAKVITGYVLVDTDETTGTFDKSDKTATFIYKKVGKIIPVDPNGNPIPGADTPTYENDPDDPTKVTPNEPTPGVPGYKTDVPNVTPDDPTKDTPVPYTKNETPETKYGLLEKFVDEEGNELAESVDKGSDYKTGDKFDVTKDAKVITGYVLVKTEGTTGTFTDSGKLAVFTYKKVGKIVPVDPKGNPIPDADTPTYKNDPDDPTKVTPNEPTPGVPGYKTDIPNVTPEDPTKDTPVVYTQDKYGLTEKFVDEEGNELSPSESKGTEYKSGDKYDVTKDAKVITGYVLVKTTDTTGTFDKSDKTAVFTYKKLGKIVPVDPKGNPIPGADTPTYKNDPDDPSKVVPNEPTPGVPGYKTDVPKVTPEDPTKDTPVPYTKNETPAAKYGLTEKFVDENGNDLVPSESKGSDYKSGDKYDVTKDAKVITGYVLVKTTDTAGTFDKSDKTAVFTYKKLGKIVPVDPKGNPISGADTPTYKNDPDDPSKVVPNEPTPGVPGYKTDVPKVTPEDPTKDTPVPYTKNETPAAKYGLTEKFVDENGNDLVPSVSKGTDYKSGDKYDVTKDAKVITGYVLVKTEGTTGTFEKSDKTAVFTYKKLGKIVPVDPKGNPIPGADTPTYKNDPDDPSKVVPNEPTPDVPGYKTDVPKVTPEDPTKDTPVPYTKNETPAAKYGLTEKFVDENGNDLVPSESKGTDYKSGDKYNVTKDAKVITGYVLVKTTDTTGTFTDGNKTAVFTYKKLGKIVPVDPNGNPIPGTDTPTYKNDPDDPSKVVPNEPTPSVPGYKTDVPKVTPEDPTKDTPVPYTKNETPAAKYGLTEKFVDENGNDLVPSESKGTDYKSGDKYDVTKDAKVITGYVLVKTTDTTGTFTDGNKTAVFTYKKLGKIVPVDPKGNPVPGADTPTYKNDPDDPSKVVPNEPTPSVPGYKTDVPNVTPEDPTKDTPVPYTKNETPAAKYGLTEKFVDENGNDLVPSVSKGTDYKSGDKYDVTKDAKVITGYVLVKTTDTTGTFTDGNKTAVFTYKKLGKIVPVDPKGNPIPGADTPTYKNAPDDPSKVVPNEPTPSVPGYTTDVPSVTPEDPTKDTPVPYTKNETPAAKYGLTEKFVDENGNDLVPSESKGTDYKSGDKYDVTKDAKVITGYVLVKTTDTTGTFGDSDKTAVFTYKKLGKIVPVDPNGNPIPGADTPTYENDPDDPSKVVPNEPTPSVPGYKTDVPNVTPEDPTKDTPVPYTKNVTPSKPSNNKPGKKGAPSAPTGPTSPTLPGSKKGKTAPATPNATAFSTGASKQTASLKQNAQAKLPQTGEATDKSRALSVLGLGVMALTALLGLAIDKKRKN